MARFDIEEIGFDVGGVDIGVVAARFNHHVVDALLDIVGHVKDDDSANLRRLMRFTLNLATLTHCRQRRSGRRVVFSWVCGNVLSCDSVYSPLITDAVGQTILWRDRR